ncbi:hypothetical protein [Noviherbaspirillum sedimenti]|uniref:Uncharacterized protein n=1 Tax=Noviherbaspirillum sedimenti TaxID=2320865 RepID=A0A3A3FVW6_9BURK|nr:hypothetical protein [Noviherbaspirillum sedimenti]RJG00338.1 hypothetical protein D3878_01065 [Noviherbaspirillum sedimenti]
MKTQEKISALRDRIAAIQAERENIEAQRRSRKEVGAHIDVAAAHWSAEADAIIKTNMARAAAGYPSEFLTVHVRGMPVDLGPLFVLLLGADAVRKAITKHLPSVPEGLGPLVRTRRLAELSDELHQVQIEEETLIREAEAAGEVIPYRPDADPAYTLTWRPSE